MQPILFPEFNDSCTLYNDHDELSKGGWAYWAPTWVVQQGFLNKKRASALEAGASVLSIGAGPAHLERTIVAAGIPLEQFTLADFEPTMPRMFRQYQFDMNSTWQLHGRFDQIWFPYSLSHRMWEKKPDCGLARYRHVGIEITRHLTAHGEAVAIGDLPPFHLLKTAFEGLRLRVNVEGRIYSIVREQTIFKPASENQTTYKP